MRRASTVAVVSLAIAFGGYQATAGRAGDPAPTPATVTVVVTETVPARWQGWTARTWARKTAQARKDANARGQTIRALHTDVRRLKHAAQAQATSSIFGTIRAFLCIHGGEGSWTDPNAPYWGGVQMDMAFMRAYGSWALARWGTADRWPPEVQLVVALTAYYSGRGFYPWPNTARACGLI